MQPFNRHVMIKLIEKEEAKEESLVVLPTDYKKPESPHQLGVVLATADDCSLSVKDGDIVVFEKRMINKIQIEDKEHYLILENFIFGRI